VSGPYIEVTYAIFQSNKGLRVKAA